MKKVNIKPVKLIKPNETMGKAFVIWPVDGMVFDHGREIGQLTYGCTLNITIEDFCEEVGITMDYVDSYIETGAMPVDDSIAFCKMMDCLYEAQNADGISTLRFFAGNHGVFRSNRISLNKYQMND